DEIPTEERPEDNFSFDEHLLERISVLEEVLKRTAETVRDILTTLQKQEKNLLINHTGLGALAETLQTKGLIETEAWSDVWQMRAQSQLLALEKRERFAACRDRIEALYRGRRRDAFLRHLRQAEVHFLSFDLDAALAALEDAYALDRANYQLAHFLGETWFNEGDAEKALRYFTRVLDLKPDHYDCLVYSGVIHYELGDLARAEAFLDRGVEVYPDAFLPLFCLGAIHAREGRLDRAASFLERAVEVDSAPQAFYLLGSAYHDMGRLLPAIRALRQATRLDPTFEEAHHLLGLAYLDRHWRRKALEAFRQAQRLNPKKMRYRDLVGYLSGSSEVPLPRVEGEAAKWLEKAEKSLQSDQAAEALRCYGRALRLEPDNPTVLMSHALACLQMNRHQESEAITRKVLDLNPGEMLKATAYAALIEALRGEGRYREGNRVGVRLLDEGRSNFAKTIAYYEMAYNLAEMEEDLDRALDYAQRSLELAPDELKEFPLAALGWVHYKRREFDQAVEFLSRSTELERSPTTLTHLGMALLASGREEQARTVLREARRLGERTVSLQEKMMEFLRDSTRLFEALDAPRSE
ncbi:MAG TPA: tetratricopeptide repeat protein, partial [Thermoanaerobaculia bacterium]|nr:tetratricopeptide repeat protein [Thermoanaerobaculia bacterium]